LLQSPSKVGIRAKHAVDQRFETVGNVWVVRALFNMALPKLLIFAFGDAFPVSSDFIFRSLLERHNSPDEHEQDDSR
jgi:hypothetical protein